MLNKHAREYNRYLGLMKDDSLRADQREARLTLRSMLSPASVLKYRRENVGIKVQMYLKDGINRDQVINKFLDDDYRRAIHRMWPIKARPARFRGVKDLPVDIQNYL